MNCVENTGFDLRSKKSAIGLIDSPSFGAFRTGSGYKSLGVGFFC
jgi:hypothetical protein